MEDELQAAYRYILSSFREDTEGFEYCVGETELNDGRTAMVSIRVEVQ